MSNCTETLTKLKTSQQPQHHTKSAAHKTKIATSATETATAATAAAAETPNQEQMSLPQDTRQAVEMYLRNTFLIFVISLWRHSGNFVQCWL